MAKHFQKSYFREGNLFYYRDYYTDWEQFQIQGGGGLFNLLVLETLSLILLYCYPVVSIITWQNLIGRLEVAIVIGGCKIGAGF
jgi:hypothetical protein